MALRPSDLIFRCYAYYSPPEGRWRAVCIDLNLWASGKGLDDVRQSLDQAILGYVEAVMDTEDRDSIPPLLKRRAPLRYLANWHLHRALRRLRTPRAASPAFYESVTPFHIDAAPA